MRFTIDIPAIAASPYAPAATLSNIVAKLPSPCRSNDGVPPIQISFKNDGEKENHRTLTGILPLRRLIKRSSTKLHIWLTSVAQAAPETPMPRTKINKGSSPIFNTAPDKIPYIAYTALPWKRIWLLSVSEPVIKGTPSNMMPRYRSV